MKKGKKKYPWKIEVTTSDVGENIILKIAVPIFLPKRF